jgi:hypothetical protein
MIVSDQVVAALASAAIPTFAVLVGILINNQRLNDFSRSVDQRFNESSRSIDQRFIDTNRHIEDVKDALRADMFRIEQVLDARLKHLEEHQ